MEDAGTESTTVETIYAVLKEDIITGLRKPGESMRIDRMRQIYGVGPTPLRETLQRLTAEGLVIARGGRGFRVANLSVAEFVDLNIARTEVDLSALRLAISSGDEEWEARIVAAAYMLEKADNLLGEGTKTAVDKWEAANRSFHAALVSACPSSWLLHLRNDLNIKCERYRRAALTQANVRRDLLREHTEIMNAVLARDTDKGCRLLKDHYQQTVDLLKIRLAEIETN